MKQTQTRRAAWWMVAAGLLGVAVAGACAPKAARRQTDVMEKTGGVSVSATVLRARVDDLAERLAGRVEETSDRIRAEARDRAIRRRALTAKIEVIPAVYSAAYRIDPLEAALDVWALAFQLSQFVEEGDGRDAFGKQQPLRSRARPGRARRLRRGPPGHHDRARGVRARPRQGPGLGAPAPDRAQLHLAPVHHRVDGRHALGAGRVRRRGRVLGDARERLRAAEHVRRAAPEAGALAGGAAGRRHDARAGRRGHAGRRPRARRDGPARQRAAGRRARARGRGRLAGSRAGGGRAPRHARGRQPPAPADPRVRGGRAPHGARRAPGGADRGRRGAAPGADRDDEGGRRDQDPRGGLVRRRPARARGLHPLARRGPRRAADARGGDSRRRRILADARPPPRRRRRIPATNHDRARVRASRAARPRQVLRRRARARRRVVRRCEPARCTRSSARTAPASRR